MEIIQDKPTLSIGTNTKSTKPGASKMSKPILSPDATYLEISSPGEFQRFYQGLIDLLKKKLNRINIGGSGLYYYTCGEMHPPPLR